MPDVTMPRLSDSMEEAVIARWLVADGERVTVGTELAEVETDKATVTFEAEAEGVLQQLAREGETVALGGLVARIVGVGETAGDAAPAAAGVGAAPPVAPGTASPATASGPAAAAPASAAAKSVPAVPTPAASPSGARPAASPLARRLAARLAVDLVALTGTGPRGRIVRADVERAANGAAAAAPPTRATAAEALAPAAAPAAGDGAKGATEQVDLSRTQQLIARRMAESRATVPDFDVSTDVDMEEAWVLREQLKAQAAEGQPVPSLNDLVVLACGRALAEQPNANASYKDGALERYARVNVGVAIAAPDSLVVATVFDADRRSLGAIARATRELAARVRDGAVTPPELAGATFTVSNLGMFGVDSFTAVINPPQAAILAVGAVKPRAVVRAGALVARRTMTITLSTDHRVLYGADAARFVVRVRELLEAPLALLAR
jgi:pyruvate dehydrogenase E2 component (dihydrolipoamide acetyltransferase)